MTKKRLSPEHEVMYPKLFSTGYEVTSVQDKVYNCVAWAATADTVVWWEPENKPGNYWPLPVSGDYDTDYAFNNYVKAFEALGYQRCDSSAHEPGVEKVAIYKNAKGEFTHAARQLITGAWTSKLGPSEDIEHKTPEALTSDFYGFPDVYLKRPFPQCQQTNQLKKSLSFLRRILEPLLKRFSKPASRNQIGS